MPFGDATHVMYKNNPLAQVLCQLKFPVILSINENSPATFQDLIRDSYPIFSKGIEQQQQVSFELPGDGLFPLPKIIQSEALNTYAFSSEDGDWTITLTNTALSLSANNYSVWDEFRERLMKPLAALIDVYAPAFFSRVGLRYINVFKRTTLGLENTAWDELLNSSAIGFLSHDSIKSNVTGFQSTTEVQLDSDALVRIVTSLGYVESVNYPVSTFDPELAFIVDNDFYTGNKQRTQVGESLEKLHNYASDLIRAVVKDRLHYAMEPELL